MISDTIKADAKSAIAAIKKQNIVTAMLTGDAQNSAEAVAKETGIDEVHAKLLPQDKLSTLKKLRETYTSVMFVGDGINDAPMLARADIGIAMGNLGSEAAIEAADVILVKDDLHGIVALMKIAKETLRSVSQNITFAVFIKILVLFMAVIGYFGMWEAILVEMVVVILAVINSAGVAGYTA